METVAQPIFPLAPFDAETVSHTVWPSKNQAHDGMVHHGVTDLTEMLEQHSGTVSSNKSLPVYALVTVRDNYRDGNHLESLYGLGFDCDSGQNPAMLLDALRAAGICFIFNESIHSEFVCKKNPTGCRRWRVLLFVSRPMTAAECGFDAEQAESVADHEQPRKPGRNGRSVSVGTTGMPSGSARG